MESDGEHTGFRVMSKRCDQCLFSDKKIVSDEAKAQILEDIRLAGNFFVCHKASIDGIGGGCCKAFYDQAEDGIVIAVKRLGLPIQWVDPKDPAGSIQ